MLLLADFIGLFSRFGRFVYIASGGYGNAGEQPERRTLLLAGSIMPDPGRFGTCPPGFFISKTCLQPMR